MFTTLGWDIHGFWNVWRFPIFRQIWQVRTCKIFHFLGNHGTGDLSIKNALNQPYQCHSPLIIIWPLEDVVWMVSNGFENFWFFIKLDRSWSFWTILKHVRYPIPINPMNVRTLSRCCSLLSGGISKFSEMFVILRFFVEFDRSGHAKFFTFWEITEWEISRSRTLSINPTNVIDCWSSYDHFRK